MWRYRFMRWPFIFLGLVSLLLPTLEGIAESPQFARDVLPLLSDRCFKCHGPDNQTRKGNLRLDLPEIVATADASEGTVVPGFPERSELFRRITATDPDDRMPPHDSGTSLSTEEIERIRHWIESGAEWEQHWAFRSLQRPPIPQPARRDWARNPIDGFILQQLEQVGMSPSPEADPTRLTRRVTLGLTGLPPDGPNSMVPYEATVDQLLASPAYGERVAQLWLDLARYADTSGYQNDGPRSMWRWRDWVLDALNGNQPFDQFTRDQLAGDLLPTPSLAQRIATGFNRNHRGNAEGGIVPEEYAVEYVVDRVETMGTVWLGLTLGCARCHDHKYDPVSQKEFYQLYAFFNNIPEHGRAIKEGNSPPYIKAPTTAQSQLLQRLDAARNEAQAAFDRLRPALDAAQRTWEAKGAIVHDESLPRIPGLQKAHQFGETTASYQSDEAGKFGYFDRFTISIWVRPDTLNGTLWSRMLPTARSSGYSLDLREGRLHVNLIRRWLDDAIRVRSSAPVLQTHQWQHVTVVYDGSRVAAGTQLYVNGEPIALEAELDALNQSFAVDAPFQTGQGNEPFSGQFEDLRIFERDLKPDEVAMLAVREDIQELLALAPEARTPAQADRIRNQFLTEPMAAPYAQAATKRHTAEVAYRAAYDAVPTVMVMEERSEQRPAHVLNRGRYDQPLELVHRAVPSTLPAFPVGLPMNRLGLAQWLTGPSSALTARVLANRLWQMHFGMGLVRTPENFGIQGEPPTHPALLDWLAVELLESGWNLKHLQRLIVTSATYRQASEWTPALRERDPENRWWARGPRFRLPAEWVRDRALTVSGLLTDRIGGPSVKPYQPEGLWKEIASDTLYERAEGAGLYRRSLYTYWKRTVSPPLLAAFDAPTREACVVQRARTNTPLQALGLLNETGYLEAAKALAYRILTEGRTEQDSVRRALELALSRRATETETRILETSFKQYQAAFKQAPKTATALLATGQTQFKSPAGEATLAALTLVCSTVLNLDEFVTLD